MLNPETWHEKLSRLLYITCKQKNIQCYDANSDLLYSINTQSKRTIWKDQKHMNIIICLLQIYWWWTKTTYIFPQMTSLLFYLQTPVHNSHSFTTNIRLYWRYAAQSVEKLHVAHLHQLINDFLIKTLHSCETTWDLVMFKDMQERLNCDHIQLNLHYSQLLLTIQKHHGSCLEDIWQSYLESRF